MAKARRLGAKKGGTPQKKLAGWCTKMGKSWKVPWISWIKMDDDWGYPYDFGNLQLNGSCQQSSMRLSTQLIETGSESNTSKAREASCSMISMVVLKFRHEFAQLPLHLQKTCHATRKNHSGWHLCDSVLQAGHLYYTLYIFSQSISAYINLWVYDGIWVHQHYSYSI